MSKMRVDYNVYRNFIQILSDDDHVGQIIGVKMWKIEKDYKEINMTGPSQKANVQFL